MKRPENNKWLDDALFEALGSEKSEANFEKWQQRHGETVEMLTSRAAGKTSAHLRPLNIWRIIVKSKITRLAAAAVIIIAALIGLTYWLPTGGRGPSDEVEIEIPPALAQMPIEQLLDIHFGKTEASFDARVVAAAVERALDRLSPRQILAIGRTYKSTRSDMSAEIAVYRPMPLTHAVEAANIVVRARVDKVKLDAHDLKAAIAAKNMRWVEHFVGWIKAEVEVNILEGYPYVPVPDGEKLCLRPVLSTRRLDVLEEGREYLITLKQNGETVWMLSYQEGVYPVDGASGMAGGLRAGPMPVDEAWEFIMDSYDAIHEGNEPSEKVLDYWLGKLGSESLTDCWTAVEYFNTLISPSVRPGLVVDAIERQLQMWKSEENWQELDNERYRRATFVKEAIMLLSYIADEPAMERMLALYEQNRGSAESVFNREFAGTYAEGLDEMMTHLVAVKSQAEPSDTPMVRALPGRKQRIQDAVDKYTAGKVSLSAVINLMRELLEPEDREFVSFLRENLTKHWYAPILASELLADTSYVPVLREALEKEVNGSLLAALYACGQKDDALEMGLAELEKPVDDQDGSSCYRDLQKLASIIRFLGTTGDKSVLPTIEGFAEEDVMESYREIAVGLGSGSEFAADKMRQDAVLALARVGGQSAIPRLKELYGSDDIHIRILAALSLFYLEDDTGYELLEHFVNNTQRSVPEIEVRWHVNLAGGYAFQEPITTYLRSPRTDALLLEKLRHGLDSGDTYAFSLGTFVREYKGEILPILVEQLKSKDRATRGYADRLLKRLTGQDFGFPDRFVGQQDEAIERWRSYVDEYLAGSSNSAE